LQEFTLTFLQVFTLTFLKAFSLTFLQGVYTDFIAGVYADFLARLRCNFCWVRSVDQREIDERATHQPNIFYNHLLLYWKGTVFKLIFFSE
jgi:hypothetical protein